jgi:FkbM family methyltransferase
MLYKLLYFFVKIRRGILLRFLGENEKILRVKNGLLMKIDPKNETDQTFYFGNYERALVHFTQKFVVAGDTCIDIGSHKGYFTLQMAKIVGEMGTVHAFDPDPNAFQILTTNVQLNKLSNVRMNNTALADKRGKCEFYLNNYLGHSSRFPNKYASPNIARSIQVETLPLDDYINDLKLDRNQKLSLIKIDAEGSEHLILEGMRTTVREFKPVLHMEINFLSLDEAAVDKKYFNDFFKTNNYSVFQIDFYRDKKLRINYTFTRLENVFNVKGKDMIDIIAINSNSEYWQRFEKFVIH